MDEESQFFVFHHSFSAHSIPHLPNFSFQYSPTLLIHFTTLHSFNHSTIYSPCFYSHTKVLIHLHIAMSSLDITHASLIQLISAVHICDCSASLHIHVFDPCVRVRRIMLFRHPSITPMLPLLPFITAVQVLLVSPSLLFPCPLTLCFTFSSTAKSYTTVQSFQQV